MPREGHDRVFREVVEVSLVISIHVPREGHDFTKIIDISQKLISIHVPREGHDYYVGDVDFTALNISIHVPREGHDRSRLKNLRF